MNSMLPSGIIKISLATILLCVCTTLPGQQNSWERPFDASIEKRKEGELKESYDLARVAYDLIQAQESSSEDYFRIAQHLATLGLEVWDLRAAHMVSNEALGQLPLLDTHQEYKTTLMLLKGWAALRLNQPNEAQTLAKQGLKFTHRDSTSQQADFYELWGMTYLFWEKTELANRYLKKANTLRLTSPTSSIKMGRWLLFMGQLSFYQAAYQTAKDYYKRSQSILEEQKSHPLLLAELLEWQAYNYFTSGQTTLAKVKYNQAEQFWAQQEFQDNPAYARVLEGLGLIALNENKLEQAENHFVKVEAINTQHFGPKSFQVAETLSNRSILNLQLQNMEEALRLSKKAESLVSPKNHPSVYCNLADNLATVYLEMGKLKKVLKRAKKVLQTRKKQYGKNNPSLATSLNNYGYNLDYYGKYEKALPYYERCYQLLIDHNQTTSKVFGDVTTNLGYYYELESIAAADSLEADQLYRKAKAYLEESLVASEKSLGKLHHSYIGTLFHLAILLENQGEIDQSAVQYEIAVDRLLKLILSIYGGFDEGTQLRYMQVMGEKLGLFYSFAHRNRDTHPHLMKKVAEVHYAVKNLSLQYSMLNQIASLEQDSNQQYLLYRQWKEIKEQLATKYLMTGGIDSLTASIEIKTLENQLAAIEKEITRDEAIRSSLFDPYQPYDSICAGLTSREIFIDFVQFPYWDPERDSFTDPWYAALIHRPNQPVPSYVPLFREKDLLQLLRLDTTLQEIPNTEKIPAYIRSSQLGFPLYQHIWKPILEQSPGDVAIHFSPDGLLHLLVLENLPMNDKGTKRVHEQFDLFRYSSFKDFGPSQSRQQVKRLIGFGEIDYADGFTAASPLRIQALEASEKELQEIKRLLEPRGLEIHLFSGPSASEANLKQQFQKPKQGMLFITAHAFFLSQAEASTSDNGNYLQLFKRNNSPLLRSGILLNEAKETIINGAKTGEDGFLTAMELATLDFSQTEMVILSACYTGLGEIRYVEGVFGLQRALKRAGAKQILMSLWQIPDKESKEFMKHFLQHYSDHGTARVALTYAQEMMRQDGIPAQYWGAFILLQ